MIISRLHASNTKQISPISLIKIDMQPMDSKKRTEIYLLKFCKTCFHIFNQDKKYLSIICVTNTIS